MGPIISDSCGMGGGVPVESLVGTVFCCVGFCVGVDRELPGKSVDAFAGKAGTDVVVVGGEVESLRGGF